MSSFVRLVPGLYAIAKFVFPNLGNLDEEQKNNRSAAFRPCSNLFLGFLLALCGIVISLILSGLMRNRVIDYENFD